jgi:hypothetical protein
MTFLVLGIDITGGNLDKESTRTPGVLSRKTLFRHVDAPV